MVAVVKLTAGVESISPFAAVVHKKYSHDWTPARLFPDYVLRRRQNGAEYDRRKRLINKIGYRVGAKMSDYTDCPRMRRYRLAPIDLTAFSTLIVEE